MKGQTVFLLIVAAALVLTLTSAKPDIDLSALSDQYGTANVGRLQAVANQLALQGVTGETLKYCLAQILQETGLFTPNDANYHATDTLKNFAGISNGDGSLKAYNNISDFVTDYIRVLNLPSNYPIDAVSISDFNQRLKQNGYYAANINTYGNNLNYYYNLLS